MGVQQKKKFTGDGFGRSCGNLGGEKRGGGGKPNLRGKRSKVGKQKKKWKEVKQRSPSKKKGACRTPQRRKKRASMSSSWRIHFLRRGGEKGSRARKEKKAVKTGLKQQKGGRPIEGSSKREFGCSKSK